MRSSSTDHHGELNILLAMSAIFGCLRKMIYISTGN
ncbi:hypothetical protein EHW99_0572 [Erwinia amylovora]|uniref:Uncharacterized protein n=3 Tax=Erwinia amylovora TaxID=552 RepID=A0A831A3R4_ERWAM|nr:hypothetical protein EaACW_3059 [Erwinia amylovora ACW56400]QJQ53279.1 hypothetical protein EHX00_0572 [Erwinia amylovora]CBA22893.1 hypothetical protein predicted by Glimmer/Critica [Erwinia amylovora CFBP1430]CBX81924.1 hypothetical protein predicted by Glimmer/Critica [Erwinia amylovora ATCC BAA-2158]CCO79900.1 hypothetical protein BN432_3121 [Erwinia amylovora Ea356]CCO83706.1 hypothetical protein BN433_3149 [Erwinia amylovora Ea266]CCO87464.1 hypothetical protein BN434_3095 [Erwinia a